MKVWIVYKPDGSVAVIHPAPKSRRDNETEEQWYDRIFTKTMQGNKNLTDLPYEDIDDTELPKTRENRNSWKKNPSGKGIIEK